MDPQPGIINDSTPNGVVKPKRDGEQNIKIEIQHGPNGTTKISRSWYKVSEEVDNGPIFTTTTTTMSPQAWIRNTFPEMQHPFFTGPPSMSFPQHHQFTIEPPSLFTRAPGFFASRFADNPFFSQASSLTRAISPQPFSRMGGSSSGSSTPNGRPPKPSPTHSNGQIPTVDTSSGYSSCESSSSVNHIVTPTQNGFPHHQQPHSPASSAQQVHTITTAHQRPPISQQSSTVGRVVRQIKVMQEKAESQGPIRSPTASSGSPAGSTGAKTPNAQSPLNQSPQVSRQSSRSSVKDGIQSALDQIDARVAFFRETSFELLEEKRKLLSVLTDIKACDDLKSITQVEQEELNLSVETLLNRLNSVEIAVQTKRTESQKRALNTVNEYIDKLVIISKAEPSKALAQAQTYLYTCSSDGNIETIVPSSRGSSVKSPTPTRDSPAPMSPTPLIFDEKFQKSIVECHMDDQKQVRRRLESLLSTLYQRVSTSSTSSVSTTVNDSQRA